MSIREDVPDIEHEYQKTLSGYKKIKSRKVDLLEYTKYLKKTFEIRFYLSHLACLTSMFIFAYALIEINDFSMNMLSAILLLMTIGFTGFFFYKIRSNDFNQTIEGIEREIQEVEEKMKSIMS